MAKSIAKKLEQEFSRTASKIENAIGGAKASSTVGTVATVAGVAALGAAGVVAAVQHFRRPDNGRASFHVVPNGDSGWALKSRDKAPLGEFDRKKDAIAAARKAAHEHAPSSLVIHGLDGQVLNSHSYDLAGA